MCESCSWEEALDACDDVLELCEELPDRAHDFGVSISEKVQGMKEWIEAEEHVTDRMEEALENMKTGVEKWMH